MMAANEKYPTSDVDKNVNPLYLAQKRANELSKNVDSNTNVMVNQFINKLTIEPIEKNENKIETFEINKSESNSLVTDDQCTSVNATVIDTPEVKISYMSRNFSPFSEYKGKVDHFSLNNIDYNSCPEKIVSYY